MDQNKWIKISKGCILTGIVICLLAFMLGGFNYKKVLDNKGHKDWYRIMVID